MQISILLAEPYIAVREGLKCSSCHSNLTGGGKRTRMGAGYGAQDLPWKPLDLEKSKVPFYWSVLEDRISFGGDFRTGNQSRFLKDNSTNSFETEKSNVYFQADLIPNRVSFYLDESVAPGGTQTREIFALVRNLPGRSWIKAGKFNLPYGLRIEDDRAFIREAVGFTFNNPDTGLEFGLEPGSLSFQATITNGTAGSSDNNTSKQFTGSAAYVADRFRIGGSASHNDSGDASRESTGIWGGLRLGKLVLLAEADWIRNEQNGQVQKQAATFAELNYEIVNGWNLKASYEYFDPNRKINENQRDRVILGVEPFLTSFVQVQIFYRFNQSIPQNRPQNADELFVRLHLFF